MSKIRWSHDDRHFGPFLYSKDERSKRYALVYQSGNEEERAAYLRLTLGKHTFISDMPHWLIKPLRQKVYAWDWNAETIERMGRDWYYDYIQRDYGISFGDNFLQVFYGIQTGDSSSDKSWSCFLPWNERRSVRHSLYDDNGNLFWSNDERVSGWRLNIKELMDAEERCPANIFEFEDYDGEVICATTRIEEREYHRGTGKFKWLSHFTKPEIDRMLSIAFSSEVGPEKGSWKGGTVGHNIEMNPDETHEQAFIRYCKMNDLTFRGMIYKGATSDELS